VPNEYASIPTIALVYLSHCTLATRMPTNDICGAECVDGSQCQNPHDSCPVPSHSDPTAENPHGRDFAIDKSDHDDILQAAREGFSKAGCARAAGVDEKSLHRYLEADEHEDFRRSFTRARHEGERVLVKGALYDEPEERKKNERTVNAQHARFILSTSFDYIKTEKKEITGEDGGALDVVINEETVEDA